MKKVLIVDDDRATSAGVADVIEWLEEKLSAPASERRVIIDAHAAYVGTPHSHDHAH